MTDIVDSTSTSTVPAPRDAADPVAVVEAYFRGWNEHDGAAVAAAVAGSYVDPTLPGPVRGPDLAAYVDGLCSAFPDLTFVDEAVHVAGDVVTAQWRMQGTNDGVALPGAPAPTGATIDFPGVDVIHLRDGRVDTVVGYFDQQAFLEQLGFQSIPAPKNEWPVTFGLGTRVDLGNVTTPGALSMTWIELADPGQVGELQQRTQDIVTALASEPSFIGFEAMSVGDRHMTFTTWTSPEAAEAALGRNAPHLAAMDRVFKEKFAARGFTGIWQPYRLNQQFGSCESCGEYVPLPFGATTATCGCGSEVSAAPYL